MNATESAERGEVVGEVADTVAAARREGWAQAIEALRDREKQDEARRRNRERLERYGLSPAPTPEGTQP